MESVASAGYEKLWSAIRVGVKDEAIAAMMSRALTEMETAVLTARFGLAGEAAMTREEAGRRIGASANEVRKAEANGLRKMRAAVAG